MIRDRLSEAMMSDAIDDWPDLKLPVFFVHAARAGHEPRLVSSQEQRIALLRLNSCAEATRNGIRIAISERNHPSPSLFSYRTRAERVEAIIRECADTCQIEASPIPFVREGRGLDLG
jgi:hypothetical protein